MDALSIQGARALRGEVRISGSKNACLPILSAALLGEGTTVLKRVPNLADVHTLLKVLQHLGAKTSYASDGSATIDATDIHTLEAPYELVRTMRASFLVLGPLLARFGRAKVSLPGGCAIGARPVDQHLLAMRALGAEVEIEHGYVTATAPNGLTGAEIHFTMPTVGGTENALLAASLASGVSVLHNVAREPEVVDLAHALMRGGVDIQGAGSDTITVHGQSQFRPFEHVVIPDRIEFGTFLIAGAICGDPITIRGGTIAHQKPLLDAIIRAGANIKTDGDVITVSRPERLRALEVSTEPYPGFPTDMQAQLMVLMSQAHGTSVVTENVFENRFMHVAELGRLGAAMRVDGNRTLIQGPCQLSGTTVMATDLRASASLILAGLVAEGETTIRRIYHLDRGYERIATKLRELGASVERFQEQ